MAKSYHYTNGREGRNFLSTKLPVKMAKSYHYENRQSTHQDGGVRVLRAGRCPGARAPGAGLVRGGRGLRGSACLLHEDYLLLVAERMKILSRALAYMQWRDDYYA
jgi:hypothetical protein